MKGVSYATVDFAFGDDAITLAISDDENSRQFLNGSQVHAEDESCSHFPQGSPQAHSDDTMEAYENPSMFVWYEVSVTYFYSDLMNGMVISVLHSDGVLILTFIFLVVPDTSFEIAEEALNLNDSKLSGIDSAGN